MMDKRQEVKALKKALRILRIMNQKGDASIGDISEEIGVPRTTAYRLLETLEAEGYVEHQRYSSLYRLTSEVRHLASGFRNENLLLEIAAPMIFELGQKIRWPVSLATPRSSEMVTRITTNFDSPMALERYRIGLGVPMLHATTGMCYLAYCTEIEREIVIGMARASGDPLQFLAHRREKLDQALQRVRDQGFCNLEFKQYREGNVGVPVLTAGRPMAGVVMRYVKVAIKREQLLDEYLPQLTDLSTRISLAFTEQTGGSAWHKKVRTESLN